MEESGTHGRSAWRERLMDEESGWDHGVSAGVGKGPAECVGVRAVLERMRRPRGC